MSCGSSARQLQLVRYTLSLPETARGFLADVYLPVYYLPALPANGKRAKMPGKR